MHNQTFNLEIRKQSRRKITAVLATEYPVQRSNGNEVLEISPKAVDLERFPLPVLRSHNSDELPVGKAINPRFDERKLIADIELSESEEAEAIYRDLKTGIINSLSVGYKVSVTEETQDGYRATAWEPYEVSLVAVPADPKSKIISVRSKKMEKVDHQEIIAIAKRHNKEHLAIEAIENGHSIEAFRTKILEAISSKSGYASYPISTEMSEREMDNFSIARAILAKADGDWSRAGFEREVLQDTQQYAKRQNSIVLPTQIMQRDIMKSGSGGNLVGTKHHDELFINYLYKKSDVLDRVTSLTGLTQDAAIPRLTGTSSAAFYAEGAQLSESTPTYDQVTLSAKTLGSMVEFSRKVLVQGLPNVESLVRSDISRIMAEKIDQTIINGSGTGNEPEGILNTSGIGAVTLGTNGAAPSYGKLIDLIAAVAQDDADESSNVFIMNPVTEAFLRKTPKVSSTDSVMILEGSTIAGRQVVVSSNIPSNLTKGTGTGLSAIIYGNMRDAIYASFGSMEITVDPYTKLDYGLIRVAAFLEMDCAIRHPESFAAIQDAVV